MVVQGSPVGAIGLTTLTYEHKWPDRVVERCQLVGHIVGSALLRRHEIREIEGRSQFETLITEFSSRLMNTPGNTDRVTDDILKKLGEFLLVERAGFLEINASRNCVVPTRHWASEGVSNSTHLRYTDVSATFPWLTGKIVANSPVVINDLDQFPSEAAEERRYCETLGIKSFTMVPALLRGKVVAALSLDSFNEHRAWDDKVLQRLRIVADMIAGAQARDKAQREIEEMHLFEQAISRISTDFVNLVPDEVDGKITAALKLVASTLDVDLITLLQPRQLIGYEVTHEWSSKAMPEREFSGIRVEKIFPWLADRLIKGEAIVISSLADFPSEASAERAAMIQAGLESVLWVPFEIRGKVAGHLAINTIRQRTWHDELIPRLRLLGEVFGETMQRRESELALQKSYREIETLKEQLQQENLYLRQEAKLSQNFGDIIGDSATLRAALQKVEQVAATDSTVLILGETGTGKELLARAIHSLSNRKDKIMIKVNCAALPSSLVEAELFGREKGAYTGALSRELGRFEIADESTILLDEIAELPLELQSKLLRVLEDGEFERLGSSTTRKVNVRVLAATNRDLAQAVADKEFREDLYYRLNVFPIELPPLHDRAEDIPQLVWAFVQEFSEMMGKTIDTIPRATMNALKTYSWPGNVRELRNVIERAMIVSPGPRLDVEVPRISGSGSDAASSDRLADIERDHIQSVLNSTAWRIRGQGAAAERLGLKPTTLEARMKKLGIERPVDH
jgi:transcriptional regulator with GAF, ATPase, and Fis domain